MAINPVMADTPTRSPKGPWKCPGKDACPTIFYDGEVKNGLLSGAPRAGHEWQAPKGCFCAGEERSHLLLEGERPSENCKVVPHLPMSEDTCGRIYQWEGSATPEWSTRVRWEPTRSADSRQWESSTCQVMRCSPIRRQVSNNGHLWIL